MLILKVPIRVLFQSHCHGPVPGPEKLWWTGTLLDSQSYRHIVQWSVDTFSIRSWPLPKSASLDKRSHHTYVWTRGHTSHFCSSKILICLLFVHILKINILSYKYFLLSSQFIQTNVIRKKKYYLLFQEILLEVPYVSLLHKYKLKGLSLY